MESAPLSRLELDGALRQTNAITSLPSALPATIASLKSVHAPQDSLGALLKKPAFKFLLVAKLITTAVLV